MLRFIDTTIPVPGLKRELELLHIADLHLSYADERDNAVMQEMSTERIRCFPGAPHTLELLKEYMRHEDPDYTVFTGDFMDFLSAKNLEALEDFLKNHCQRHLYTPGNHDWYCPGEASGSLLQRQRHEQFSRILGGTTDFQVINAGGVKLIGMDNAHYRITQQQLERLESEFAQGVRCLLFFHVPLFAPTLVEAVGKLRRLPIMAGAEESVLWERVDGQTAPDEITREFYRLVCKKSSPVAGVVAGHMHFTHEDIFGAGKKQYVSPHCGGEEPQLRRIRLVPEGVTVL